MRLKKTMRTGNATRMKTTPRSRTPLTPMTLDDLRRLLGQLDYAWQPYIRLRLFAGLTHEEAVDLQWRDVDEIEHNVIVGAPPRTVHLIPAVASWLPPPAGPNDRVLVGRVTGPKENVAEELSFILAAEGMSPRPLDSLHEHFAVLHLGGGESVERVAAQMGLPVEEVRARYGQYYREPEFGVALNGLLAASNVG